MTDKKKHNHSKLYRRLFFEIRPYFFHLAGNPVGNFVINTSRSTNSLAAKNCRRQCYWLSSCANVCANNITERPRRLT